MTNPIAIGSVIEVNGQFGCINKFVVQGYDDRTYMKLTSIRQPFTTMTLHPKHAQRIADNGDSMIKVFECESLNSVEARITTDTLSVEAIAKLTPVTSQTSGKTVSTAAKGTSKKVLANEIKKANPTATRKETIAMFMAQLDMSQAGASTYYSYPIF
jgi:hypothetical protein